ncbi:MAG: tRNA 2-thiocytidine biosynthesis protein TtcA [Clostridia bacterium]|nr:tRNA 2-thiocytidine biosynthesis protein TtcA [Clostridia bacterium]
MEQSIQPQVERSIIKTYRKEIWNRFVESVKRYDLLQEGDKVCVCLSGGKDSMLLAKCMQQLQRHSDFPFSLSFLVLDPGYAPENRAQIEQNAAMLGVSIKIFEANIFRYVEKQDGSPCYLCARMRRGYLYKYAQQLGCNKIALGHHFDDVIETILMSILYGGEVKTMLPKLHSTNFPGMELIRPLYLVKEHDILRWVKLHDLRFPRCACAMKQSDAAGESGKRAATKALIASLRKENSNVDSNIFHAIEDVNLETLLGYRRGETHISFLDQYDEITE